MKSDLSNIDTQDLIDEINRRENAKIDEERAERKRLAKFIGEHREEMTLFFKLGGCKRPEECVDSLVCSEWDTPDYVPVAYITHSPLPIQR